MPQMQGSLFLATVAVWLMACGQATSPEEVDTSVSSAIANTMAAIEGRASISQAEPPMAVARIMAKIKKPKLGLSKVSHEDRRTSGKKVNRRFLVPAVQKTDAPKQLAGYLGWSKKEPDAAFSTQWKTTGAREAASLDIHGLQHEEKKPAAPQQALVTDSVSTAFSAKLEDDIAGATVPIDLDWGAQAKANQPEKMSSKVEASDTRSSNSYLGQVGWKDDAPINSSDENPYLDQLGNGNKKFLMAAAVSTKQEKHGYFDDLMPNAAFEVALR